MKVRGIRGATIAEANTPAAIRSATRELLTELVEKNALSVDDIASAFFSTTPELDATFPAEAARQLGWLRVPMMCNHEMAPPGSMPGVIRVLLHVNTDKAPADLHWAYQRGTDKLRGTLPPIEEDR